MTWKKGNQWVSGRLGGSGKERPKGAKKPLGLEGTDLPGGLGKGTHREAHRTRGRFGGIEKRNPAGGRWT